LPYPSHDPFRIIYLRRSSALRFSFCKVYSHKPIPIILSGSS
jgi:hypothetical protein